MFLLFRDFELQASTNLKLEPDETRHLRARRMSPGDTVFVGDGLGRRWSAQVLEGLKSLALSEEPPESFSEPERILLVSPASGKRWDWLVQKATELGVTKIQPLVCAFTERKEVSPNRSRRILLEAASQSRRFTLPEILEPISFTQALESGVPSAVLLDPSGQTTLNQLSFSDEPLSFFIGPEGGFSPEELKLAGGQDGITIARLGSTILRTETAALAALACALV